MAEALAERMAGTSFRDAEGADPVGWVGELIVVAVDFAQFLEAAGSSESVAADRRTACSVAFGRC